MIPILYKSDEVDFYDNGLGALNDIYDVDVQEQRNGLFTLTASYPVSGRRYKDIEVGRIVLAKPNQNDKAQAFRIIHTELDISGYALTIEADHITYDLTHNLVKSVHLQGNGQNAMTHLQQATVAPHLFRFISDLQHEGDSTLTMVNPMEAIAGTQGSILQIWGGELKRDNRTVSMLSRRGRNNFTSFRLGKNINGLKYTVDTANLVTRIVPSVQRPNGNENELIIGDIVDSKNVGNYPNYYMQHVDVADNIKIDENDSDDVIKAKINAYAKNWFTQSANSKIDLPEVTVEIDVTSLQDSADYQDKFKNLEAIELTDSVTVYVPEFGVNVQAVVNELHYDPVAERVTSIVIGTSKLSFADANANTLKELGSSINKIRENAVTAIVSANGKNTNYYGTEEPAHPVEGDLWFKSVGDETYLMIFKDGRWQEWVSTKTQDIINKQVDDALASAKEYTDELNDRQASEAAVFQSEANAALSSAAAERAVFSSNAASMATSAVTHADSMANSASAYAKAEAASALSEANDALTAAKSDLTTSIEQEIADRNEAVQTVNSQAQDYASQAKSDAIAAAETADGVVRKDFKTTTDSLSSTITQNKKDTDGKISTAQTTATQALDGLKTKVSQTDYNTKTGQLQTDLTATTQTANQAKLDIVSIKSEADTQSAQINDIVSDAKGTKQTISDLKTEQGKQSGSIATLQSRADGFDASITKINDFVNSQGQVNQLTNTEFTPDLEGWSLSTVNGGNSPYKSAFDKNVQANMVGFNTTNAPASSLAILQQDVIIGDAGGGYISLSWQAWAPTFANYANLWIRFYASDNQQLYATSRQWTPQKADGTIVDGLWTRQKAEGIAIPANTTRINISFQAREGINAYLVRPMLVFDDHIGDYIQGNYNNNGALAKVKLTADKATLDLSNYKKDADGRISQAQADITATANAVSTKVSQSDYDKKTQDLDTKYGQVKVTADAVTTDVASYKSTNDKKVDANTASIQTLNNEIDSKVSQTEYDKKTQELSGNYTETKQTVDKISNTVTELQAKANAQGQVNQLMNTEFNPDLEGWTFTNNSGTSKPYKSYIDKAIGSTSIGFNTVGDPANTYGSTVTQDVPVSAGSNGIPVSMRWDVRTVRNDYYTNLWLTFKDSTGAQLGSINKQWSYTTADNSWHEIKWENVALPDGTRTINVTFAVRENTTQYLARPMLVFGETIGDYVSGNYNNNARVAALEVDINGITGLVKDPNKGLSATWNLASDGQSIAVQAKTAASTADGKAVAAQKDATTANTTANGTQTTVTNVQKDVKDLQSTTTQTAGQVTTEIEDRKNGDKSVRTDMADLIDQRITDTKKGYESAISQSADKIMASVSTPNQLLNTEFNPDLEGWIVSGTGSFKPYRSYIDNVIGSVSIGFGTVGAPANSIDNRIEQTISLASYGTGNKLSMRWDVRTTQNDNYTNLWLVFLDGNGQGINQSINHQWSGPVDNAWHEMKWENVQVPDNARQVRVTFNVRENTRQYLARPMLVFGSTIGSYMPGSYSGMNTSTVLELFKDNWALGIADNAGRLISGINGDTSGTVIQGKKLVINSDTTINGKAFIDGAVIKNASIGNAQIGNAAIGSAQIINVDVSKISGNIANFITTNVDTLNARVLYGDTGHLGTTDTGRIINKQDNHLQLAAKGFYDSTNDRAQLELLGNSDNSISDNMKGSLNYYGNPTDKGHGLGIRLKYNQILAIDEDGGSKNLYLSPYAGGQVRIVSRDLNSYYDIAAANFRVSSQRKFKSDIKPLEDGALDIVNKTNIKSYTKNGVSEIGVIADEAPSELLSDDGKFINIYDYTSVLYKAVQELSAQVKELQSERPNN